MAKSDYDFLLDALAVDEQMTVEPDPEGILTGPYGVVIDPRETSAYANNMRIAEELGIELNRNTSTEDFARVARGLIQQHDNVLRDQIPNYDQLSNINKYVLIDTRHNTGQTYKGLAKDLLAYQENPTEKNARAVVQDSRRVQGGTASEGLDNRVAKVLYRAGVVDDIPQARDYGLLQATDTAGLHLLDRMNYTPPKDDLPVVEPGTTDTQEPVYMAEQNEDYTTVDKGDTLNKIASRTGLELEELLAQNPQIKNPDLIEPGQQIYTAERGMLSGAGDFVQGITSAITGGTGTRLGMNEGGMAKQMEMFDDGGLLQEGGSVDPFSGNDVPVGSTQEEVRDDIPAQLSEGEFVFPADVVRYHGLEKLMDMRQEAKQGLQVMDAMGQMGNSEEAIIPDDIPFNIDDLDMEDDGVQEFNVGGMPQGVGQVQSSMTDSPTGVVATAPITGAGQFAQVQSSSPYSMGQAPAGQATAQPAGTLSAQQLIPSTELRQYINESGQIISIPFANGQPVYPIPAGFKPYSEQAATPAAPPVATAPPAPAQQDTGGGDDDQQDTFGQGATTVFGGVSKDGLIQGGTTYEVSYDRSSGSALPGVLGLLGGGFDRVTLTDAGGRKATMSKDMYDSLKGNRTSSYTTETLERLFDATAAADQSIRQSGALDKGFLGTGIGGNYKEIETAAAKEIYDEYGLDYKGQPLAEALIVQQEAEKELSRPEIRTPSVTTPAVADIAPLGDPYDERTGPVGIGTGPLPEVSLTATETLPDGTKQPVQRIDATNVGGSQFGFGAMADTRPATAGDVARLEGMSDVKVGQMLTPTEMAFSDERTMQRVDAPTVPVTKNVEVSTINRFGKLTDYQKVGDDYFRVKDDGSLASAPATGLTAANLRNPDSPIVTRGSRTVDTGERIALPTPRPDRAQLERDRIFAEETSSAQEDIDRRASERLAADIDRNRAQQDALQTIRDAERAQREEQNRRAAEEESAQRNQVRQRAEDRAEQQRDAQAGRGNIVTSSSGRPVIDRSGNAVVTTAGSKVDRATIEKQADAMRAEATRAEAEQASSNDDGGGDSGGGKIVCTEMYRQTELDDWARAMKVWDIYQRKYLTPLHEVGYHWLFKPYVKGMQKSGMLTSLGAYLAKERTQHLRHVLTKGRAKDSLVGNLWCKIIHPIVYVAGKIKNG